MNLLNTDSNEKNIKQMIEQVISFFDKNALQNYFDKSILINIEKNLGDFMQGFKNSVIQNFESINNDKNFNMLEVLKKIQKQIFPENVHTSDITIQSEIISQVLNIDGLKDKKKTRIKKETIFDGYDASHSEYAQLFDIFVSKDDRFLKRLEEAKKKSNLELKLFDLIGFVNYLNKLVKS